MADREDSPREMTQAKKKQIATAVSYALLALLLVLVLILCIGALADGCETSEGNGTESGDSSTPTDKIKFGSASVTAADAKMGTLVLANALNDYEAATDAFANVYSFWNTQQGTSKAYRISGMFTLMDKTALEALDRMLTDCAQATGSKDVLVRTGYMTESERAEYPSLLREHADDWKTGLGVELRIQNSNGTGNSKLSANPVVETWLNDNAAKYGFVVRYPNDKAELTGVAEYTDYFRYVGVAHATYMKANGLCLEEYIERLPIYTSKDRLTIQAVDGKTYEVYYCEVTGDTQISCPTNYVYTVSGTNKGGVIVTVDRSQLVDPNAATGTSADGTGTTAEPSTETGAAG